MQKGIVVFVFANYLDDVLVWNCAMSGLKRGVEKAGMGSFPTCICVLNSLYSGFRLQITLGSGGWVEDFCVHMLVFWSMTMIALYACWRLEKNGNGRANADNNKS
jgi:hypothetical protein